ncbi:MAG: acyl-CoA dehydrogenase [Clostridia bacterium]
MTDSKDAGVRQVEWIAQDVAERIRQQSLLIEQTGKLTDDVLAYIYEQKLFKLFVPEALGGRMMTLPDAVRLFERSSWVDGSFGWLVTIGSGGGFFVPFLTSGVAEQVYAPRSAVIAGSGHPSGVAKPVPGGYRVSGQWKYCSGSTHATVFTANCVIESDELAESPEIRSFILRPDQVAIVDDWKAFGLKATESHSIVVNDVFVAQDQTFSIFEQLAYHEEPIYRYPFLPFAQASFAAVAVGIGRHFVEEAKALVQRNAVAWNRANPKRASFVMDTIATAEAHFEAAAELFLRLVDESWALHIDGAFHEEKQQHVSQQCQRAASASLQCAQSVYHFLGIQATMEDTAINRIWRDLHTACQHSLLIAYE